MITPSTATRPELTPRQKEVYRYIVSVNRLGIYPTIIEIGKHLKIRSFNGVVDHLNSLELKGWITREPHKARSIRATGDIDHQEIDIQEGQTIQAGPLTVQCLSVKNKQAQIKISRSL